MSALALLIGCGLDASPGGGRLTADSSAETGGEEAGGGSGMGEYDVLERSSEIGPGWACKFGGVQWDAGHDNGMGAGTPHDGELHDDEVDTTWYECFDEPPSELIDRIGLDEMPLNESCFPPEGPATTGYQLVPAFADLQFPPTELCLSGVNDTDCSNAHRPIALQPSPHSGQWYLVEQGGRVLRFDDSEMATDVHVALDIEHRVHRSFESGLLSLSFDPLDTSSAYIYYIACEDPTDPNAPDVECGGGESLDVFGVVSRFAIDEQGDLDPDTETVLFSVPQPTTELNGAGTLMGADGRLWVGFGDGGAFPSNEAQDPSTLLGKVLRVNVRDEDDDPIDDPPYYTIPSDNPLANDGSQSRPEIWAMGFHNPVSLTNVVDMGWDDPTLLVVDRGLATAEEVDLVHKGRNYGWPRAEGTYCRTSGVGAHKVTVNAKDDCLDQYEFPIHSHRHAFGDSSIGGVVYRGTAMPKLVGKYIFADFSTGQIRAIDLDLPQARPEFLLDTPLQISAFGVSGDRKRVYVVDWWSGSIYRLIEHQMAASRPSSQLKWTGCVDEEDPTKPAPGYIPYAPSIEKASVVDGVYTRRRFYPPPYTVLTEYDDTGTLIFQPGSVLVKDLMIQDRLVETQFLFRHDDGGWSMWTYRWEEDQSDAVLVERHEELDIDGQDWTIKDRGECEDCHTVPSGVVLGLRTDQLNSFGFYEGKGVWANQLETLRALELINRVTAIDPDEPIGGDNAQFVPIPDPDTLPNFPALDDDSYPLLDRVAGYLHANCAGCHQPGTGVRGPSLLAVDLLDACDEHPVTQIYDDPEDRQIAPGSPFNSAIYRRIVEDNLPYHMDPYLGAVDELAADLVFEWIDTDAKLDCPSPDP